MPKEMGEETLKERPSKEMIEKMVERERESMAENAYKTM